MPCASDGTALCLNGGRFEVKVDWAAPSKGTSGHGVPVPVAGDTGYMWFFSGANIELMIKVLDGRQVNGHFWVFYGALSNVQYHNGPRHPDGGGKDLHKSGWPPCQCRRHRCLLG